MPPECSQKYRAPPSRVRRLTVPLRSPSPRTQRDTPNACLQTGAVVPHNCLRDPETGQPTPVHPGTAIPRGTTRKLKPRSPPARPLRFPDPGRWATLCPMAPRRNHLPGRRGPRPPNSLDASGAPSRPDSPLAEGPHPHGHPHVRHPSASAQAWQDGPAAASPAPAPTPTSPQPRPSLSAPRAPPPRGPAPARAQAGWGGACELPPILSPVGK